ncbi:MAG: DNA polymerase III subunit delta [Rhodothermales bacterium]
MAATESNYEQLATAFRHRNFKPLYFFYGEERFLAEELQDLLVKHGVAPHERDFNLDIVYGSESDAQSVMSLCSSYPMMAERRVVIVRDFDKLKDNRLFKEYADRPNPTAVVLLACSSKPNLATHPYKALREKAVSMECKALWDNQMPAWIQKRAESQGYSISHEAVRMLADFVGTSLRSAAGELDKLTTFTGGGKTITADDVVHATGQTREFNVFELQRAIGEGRSRDAHRISERMLQQASNPRGEALMMVAVLTSYFLKLWKLTACQGKMSEQAMAGRIGVPPFFVKEYLASLRRFRMPSIEEAFSALLAADYELKGGSGREERLVLSLMLRQVLGGAVGVGGAKAA